MQIDWTATLISSLVSLAFLLLIENLEEGASGLNQERVALTWMWPLVI